MFPSLPGHGYSIKFTPSMVYVSWNKIPICAECIINDYYILNLTTNVISG